MLKVNGSECEHEWLSDESGVKCLKCGLKLTAEEFIKVVNGSPKTSKKAAKNAMPESKEK